MALLKLNNQVIKQFQWKAIHYYRSRGFVTSSDYVIWAHENVGLPAPECLMVKELISNSLEHMSGYVSYEMYEALR